MGASKERWYDVDWVRIGVTLAVLFFHCARYFNHEEWHVKNPELSTTMDLVVGLLALWIMPAFFAMSGIGSFHSLSRRTGGAYLLARVKRLLVPLAFGILVFVPPQVYIERASHGQFAGSFWAFYPHYFDGWYGFGGNFAWMGLHLWYLEVLFIFSLISLPVFAWLRGRSVDPARPCLWRRPGALVLWAVPMMAVELLVSLAPGSVGRRDFGGWSLFVYLVVFMLGYLLGRDVRTRAGLVASRWIALVTAAVVTGFLVAMYFVPSIGEALGSTGRFVLRGCLRPLASWCWILTLLGFAGRHLNVDRPLRKHANEGVLPFYALHQSVIVVLGYWMMEWSAGVGLKYASLLISSFVVIMVLYLGLIRPFKPVRWLFGMR